MQTLPSLLKEIRGCQACELPLGPRPIVQAATDAKIVIVGQAPGTAVHESGVPWDDPSGDHLRDWLEIDRETFYDPAQVAIVPMGFCYPGKSEGGDAPPSKTCAPLWHDKILEKLGDDVLILLVGMYAQKYYLEQREKTLTETVRNYENYLPEFFPLPHPSWRSKIWMKKNDWFEDAVLPKLREEISNRV